MPITDRTVIDLTPEAITAIADIRAEEPDADELALTVGIAGVASLQFRYELTFVPLEDVGDDDVLQYFGDLPVAVLSGSADNLQGATVLIKDGGLSIDNPNPASPVINGAAGELTGPLADKVRTILEEHINPAIGSHGGTAQLVAAEGDTVYLRLGGGCQGCGMAQVTLRQGIEAAIKQALPEVKHIIDVTDHESGTNPYYESAGAGAGHGHEGHSH
jgi:Fe/S biogenesis protein NfuA